MRFCMLLLLPLLFGGCTLPWVRGDVKEAMPRHVNKFPKSTVFYVDKCERRVRAGFVDALMRRGFSVTSERDRADIAIEAKIEDWEYNEAFGRHDDMTISVKLVDVHVGRIESRASIELRGDFRIIDRYVDGL